MHRSRSSPWDFVPRLALMPCPVPVPVRVVSENDPPETVPSTPVNVSYFSCLLTDMLASYDPTLTVSI